MNIRFSFFVCLIFLSSVLSAQNENASLFANDVNATRADSLRGSERPERTCYDLFSYDLHIKVDTLTQSISGSNRIGLIANTDFQKIQIDLFSNMDISRITHEGVELSFKREFNAVFITMNRMIQKEEKTHFIVYFSGKPVIAKNPPWDGGFSWTRDARKNQWIGVSCQGLGASAWWPCKDDLSDEPTVMSIHCSVPHGLRCIANGTEDTMTPGTDGYDTYHWDIHYPINNYNVSLNIGDYVHWHDVYTAQDNDTLSLDYYVLRDNLAKAQSQFTQVKPMLRCYEKYLGKYPFWKDGYALVETPYLGMEHQGAIAYGNKYKRGYLGMDRSGMHLPFDYIIIHETGHEWWGNSVSARDLADMWIHESFCTYSEAIYVECMYNYDTAMTYVNALKNTVSNSEPIIGTYGINREGHSDMYVKGMLLLNTLRHVVDNDVLWWSMIKNMSDTTFKLSPVEYSEVVKFFNDKTGMNLTPVFEQYVKHAQIPTFYYTLKKKKHGYKMKYRWVANVKDFNMPIDVMVSGKKMRVYPTMKLQKMKVDEEIELLPEKFYVRM